MYHSCGAADGSAHHKKEYSNTSTKFSILLSKVLAKFSTSIFIMEFYGTPFFCAIIMVLLTYILVCLQIITA
jgi:hypothetical protein